MKRKVVQHGPSTLIISLPNKWIKKYGVKKGDELEVLEENNNIIVSTDATIKETEVEADISNLDRTSIMYILRSFYRLGYDHVRLNFKNTTASYQRKKQEIKVTDIIHKEVNRLIGYEILNENMHYCEIKDLQEGSIKDFDQILRRIFLLLMDASEEFLEGIKKNDKDILETIENKHDTITKFVSYCMRILNKKSYPDPKKTSYYYHIIAYMDRVTDIIKYAARDVIEYKKKLDNKTVTIIEKVMKSLRQYYELFYKYDNNKIIKINNCRYESEKELRALPEKISNKEIMITTSFIKISEILLDLIEARTALEY